MKYIKRQGYCGGGKKNKAPSVGDHLFFYLAAQAVTGSACALKEPDSRMFVLFGKHTSLLRFFFFFSLNESSWKKSS